ncbi:hypothetical protein [Pelomonas sp. SE-A7]|uniref:hypothetical protein n=1 Tax=Pelomonas sp. SE-A7 TaxID=3054953 RepID=UPI00259CBE4E|nr:hypothetical protein [Pelomonas sp. SE-A7]MDM4767710.1 hypothetical protein [Pelomonas sp. SE-A7]
MSGAAGRATPLLFCVALAVGGHLLLALPGWRAQPAEPAVHGAVNVRLLAADAKAATEPPVQAVPGEVEAGPEPKAQPAARSAAVFGKPVFERFEEQDYLARRELSVAPALVVEVPLVWPAEGVLAGHYSEVATLFIDEAGLVRKVRFEGDGLPDLLQQQAREAFLGSRFSPGQLDGKPVKSRIRIQVAFDAEGRVRKGGSGL